MEKPLHPSELKIRVAEQMWKECRSKGDPIEPPLAIYAMAEIAIKEIYVNVDKMLLNMIRDRLEELL